MLGVPLDCKLSWSKYVDTTAAKMRRSLSIKCCSVFLTTIKKAGPKGPSFVAPGLLCHKEGLRKMIIGSGQGSTAGPLTWMICMSIFHGSKWRRDWLHSLLVFVRSVDMLNTPSCLFNLLTHSSDTHPYPTRHATRSLFTIPTSRTDYGRLTELHRATNKWNSIPHQVTDAAVESDVNTPYGTASTVKRHTHR
jgi:hypothetical protein